MCDLDFYELLEPISFLRFWDKFLIRISLTFDDSFLNPNEGYHGILDSLLLFRPLHSVHESILNPRFALI
ncbi:hypothetical protein LEP1GSC066_3584 [Leptospira sp. serovar Kenya str. Sh9]|uniref:Uncharacterized protein n=1 Tax=Leptospira borgpetersenii str. 200701203 TaxID=1193007 RepID=M3FCR1_LEPBO|nr:Uncharacterized protein LB4E_0052 [Leptospira borgpetersenii str. 4E]EMF99627.1 hypothetical protein LEP1GSC123_2150 [Leptospira borgpetersenii str. 200701203]EMK14601.1 hypothetical protein LEP1GSC066_3584 [Leptospira sp. serovar Kenya str. Sh9]KGE26463.1 hypothetical protein IQ66_00640 [Leptospira borgpetersenii serovar Ballum]